MRRVLPAAFRTALAGIRVNDVHAGRIRAGQQNDSALTRETRAAWLRLTRPVEAVPLVDGPQNDERPGFGNSFRPGLLHWSG
jgi:hypothetical protein